MTIEQLKTLRALLAEFRNLVDGEVAESISRAASSENLAFKIAAYHQDTNLPHIDFVIRWVDAQAIKHRNNHGHDR